MNAWTGKVLRVNLTKGLVEVEKLNFDFAKNYIGGRGLGVRYFVNEVSPKVDPLSAENKLIFATGPLTGCMGASTGRYEVVTKSPLTGTIAGSNSGGHFGPELKYAGYDMVIFEGKSPKPVYLSIDDDKVELRSAEELWGKDVPTTTDTIVQATSPSAKVCCIGLAGEKMALLACIMNDKDRAAGRTGLGAVMGSKNLKAIAVHGTGNVIPADAKKALDVTIDVIGKLKAHPVGGTGLPTYGTNILVNIINESGGFPTRNFTDAQFATANKIGGESLADKQLVKKKSCFGCPISCGRVCKVTNEKYAGYGEGPEYESAWSFGGECGVDNLDAVVKANFICNENGLDTISIGSTIGCLMEMYEAGLVKKEDIGFEIGFGDEEAMVKLVSMAANLEGIGKLIAQGSYRLSEKFGDTSYSMSVKKLEMPAYDPRAIQGIGLNYATSNNGAAHVRGYTISPEVLGVPQKIDQFTTEAKEVWVKGFQDLTACIDSSGICLFTTFGLGAPEIADQLAANTGLDYTADSIVAIGERIHNLERLFNLKAGITPADDTLPKRMFELPVITGPAKGNTSKVKEMLPAYYKLRGWGNDGIPSKDKLKELELSEIKFL